MPLLPALPTGLTACLRTLGLAALAGGLLAGPALACAPGDPAQDAAGAAGVAPPPRPPAGDETPIPGSAADGPRAGDLLVLDADAGAPLPGGERQGLLWLVRRRPDGSWAPPEPWGDRVPWREPVALEPLADGSLLVVDSAWPSAGGPSRGALFRVTPDGRVQAWWQDPRLRMPVSAVQGPDGTVYVSDRSADPGGLGRPTGAVFAVPVGADGRPAGPARVAAAGPELETPSALARLPDGRLLLMEADLNPTGATRPDGLRHTPGVLYELTADGLVSRNTPALTVSPIGLVVAPPELLIVDANAGLSKDVLGDGAIWSLPLDDLGATPALRVDSAGLGERALIDPAGGDLLEDGRLVLADANSDPLRLGPDGTGKGVYAVGRGAVVAVDWRDPAVEVLVASERFVMPLDVWRVRW